MKRHYTLLAGFVFSTFIAFGQTVTTIYDGETNTPDFWDLGGNPPNGASCPSYATWTLNVSGKMDILTEGLANPFPGGLNTTEKVVRTVRAKDGDGWAGAALNVSGLNLNISQTNHFSVLVYKEIEGNFTMKLEGAGSQEVTAYYNTPGQWQKMEFTFDAANFSGSPTTLLVFPHNQTGLSETILTYWDEVTMYDASNNPTVIYNGNDPVSGFFIDGYWGPNGALNNLETDIFPNQNKSGINTSNHVIRFLRAKDGESWCGMGLGGLNINVNATSVISLMVLKSVAGKVGAKLEGAGSQEIYADYNTPGEWTRLTFTFDKNVFTGNPNTLIIFPHFEDTKTVNLPDHLPMYIDNVILRDNSTVATDYFRSKTSGNWGDVSTWESSYDNVNWVTATAVPTSAATSVTIQNGHLVTVADNATASILIINSGAKLTLNSEKTLNVEMLNILSDATNGTGTFVDNGTFTATTANVQQYLTDSRNWYIASPVIDAQRTTISTTSSVVSYNEATAQWDDVTGTLQPLKGYIAVSPTAGTIAFSGTLNTGEQTISLPRHTGVTKEGFQLVGNPYPSYVNWTAATKTNLSSTMWYRTKSATAYVFDTFNATNGLGTSNNNTNSIPVTGDIAPMQAFWVRALAGGGSLTFTNAMRSHQDQSVVTNRLKAPAQTNAVQQVLRLQVSNGINSDETIILFNANASNGMDNYDSPKMLNNNNSVPEIYSTVGTEKLVINGLNSIDTSLELPLGFSTGEANTFTIKSTEIQNFNADTKVLLRDNLTNTEQEMFVGSDYTFTSTVAATDNRFTLVFKVNSTLTANNALNDGMSIYRNVNNNFVVYSKSQLNNESYLTIYNSTGQRIVGQKLLGKYTVIGDLHNAGVYLFVVKNEGKTTIEKVIQN